jgi:serine/threonine protein kinase/formylglycine-generating enzyme required for sulfatase activity
LLCYRCGSHVPDGAATCESCGQPLSGGAKPGGSPRRRPGEIEAPFKVGDVLARRYRIKEVVGQGPLGFVFRATDEQVEMEVAIKLLQPKLLQTEDERVHFGKVIRLSRKFSHPSLARTYEDGAHDTWPFFTAPHCDGMSLRKILEPRIAKQQFFTLKEVEPVFAQLAVAVDAAHAVGVHGNLKPENVLLQPDVLKVTDFGLAMALPRLPFIQAQKASGGNRYLSPEYLAGGAIDPRADVYALGVILGEMLSGQTPQDGQVPLLKGPGRDIPPALEGIYRRALNENPQARFRSASELLAEIRTLTGARPAPPPLKTRAETPMAVQEAAQADATMPISAAELAHRLGRLPGELPPSAPPPVPTPDQVAAVPPRPGAPVAAAAPPKDTHSELETAAPPKAPTLSELPTAAPPSPRPAAPTVAAVPRASGPPPGIDVTAERPVVDYDNPKEAPTAALPIPELEEPTSAPEPLFAASREEPKARGVGLLVILGVTGLAIGAGGGLWLLKSLRAGPAQVSAAGSDRSSRSGDRSHRSNAGSGTNGGPGTGVGPATGAGAGAALDSEPPAHEKSPAGESAHVEPAAVRPSTRKAHVRPVVTRPPPSCPRGMKLIPAGSFPQGTARDDPMMGFDERPLTTVSVKAYCIDELEFPNRAGVMPKVKVSWLQAKRACERQHKRLCSESEWEKACKGPEELRYPYGNRFDAAACATEDASGHDRQLGAAGHYSRCRSGYGVMDLSGNAAEWTASSYAGGEKVVKGGAFNKQDYAARCSARKNGAPASHSSEVGFRCCADPS